MKILEKKFEQFFMNHYPKVKNFARKLVKSEEDAEDIAQEVFLKLWKTPELWNNNDLTMDSYLFKMTKNKVIDLIRKRVSETDYTIDDISESNLIEIDDKDTLSNIYCKEIQLILKLSLEQMPEQRSKVFKMSRITGKSNKEIAEELNISVRTVEHHIYLALTDLKKMLNVVFLLFFL